MVEDILASIFADTVTNLIILIIVGLGSFFVFLYKCTHKTSHAISAVKNEISNLQKAFLVVIETSEAQTKRDHPEYDVGNLLKKAKIIMGLD